jgi:steroid delta-isomerase-like uncharacterized protein
MSTDDNKNIARRFIEEVMAGGKMDAVDSLVTADFRPHSWGNMPAGTAAFKQAMKRVAAGLSDTRMIIEDMIAEGDKVAVRLTAHGVHKGEFMGMKPTGKAYTIPEIHIFRIQGGKISEHWREADMLGMMQQLGALPQPQKKAS